MAESYRGLTIRIGGDTTKLSQALRAANQSISQTGMELRKLGQTLKLDPGNVEAYNTQLGYMSQHATNTAMKLQTLKTSLAKLESEDIKLGIGEDAEVKNLGEYVDELTKNMGSVSAATARAKEEANSYNQTVASMHTLVSNFAKEAAKLKKEEISEALDLSDDIPSVEKVTKLFNDLEKYATVDEKAVKELKETLKALSLDDTLDIASSMKEELNELKGAKALIEEDFANMNVFRQGSLYDVFNDEISKIEARIGALDEEFVSKFSEAGEAADGELEDIINKIAELIEKATGFEGIEFTTENGKTDIDAISAALEAMAGILHLDTDEIADFVAHLDDMSGKFAAADKNYKTLLKVERMQDLRIEIQKTEATIKNLGEQMASIKGPSDIARGFTDITTNISMLKENLKELKSSFSDMGKVIGIDPSNTEALDVALRTLTESQQSVAEQARATQAQLDAYAEKGYTLESVTDSTKSAAQQLYDTAKAAAEAQAEYTTLAGAVEEYQNMIDVLEGHGEKVRQTFGRDEENSGWEALQDNIKKYVELVSNAEDYDIAKAEALRELKKELANVGGELDEESGKYEKVAAARARANEAMEAKNAAQYRKEMEALQSTLAGTIGELDKVDKAVIQLAENMAESSGANFYEAVFGGMDSRISGIDSQFSAAAQRATVLGKAASEAADGTALAEAAAKALASALKLGQDEAEELRNNLSSMEVAGIDSSGLDAVNAKFGSAGNAVRLFHDEIVNVSKALGDAQVALGKMDPNAESRWTEQTAQLRKVREQVEREFSEMNPFRQQDHFDEYYAAIERIDAAMQQEDQTFAEYTERHERLSATVAELTEKLNVLREAQGEAIAYEQYEEMREKLLNVLKEIDRLEGKEIKLDFDVETSASDELKKISDELKDMGFKDTGIDEMLEKLKLVNESVDANKSSFDRYKAALKDSPKDMELLEKTTASAEKYMRSLEERIKAGETALKEWDMSTIDETAVAAGTVGAKFKEAENEFKTAQAEVERLEEKSKKAHAALESMAGVETEALENEIKEIESELDKAKTKAKSAEDALKNATNTKTYVETKVQVDVDKASLAKAKEEVDNEFKEPIKVDQAAFQSAISEMSQVARQAGQKIVDSSNTIDVAYRNMRKTVQGTEEQFQSLHDEAVKFSQTHITSADQMLEMEALGGQLGINVEALQSFGETAANLDIATDIDSEEIALKLGQITNVMGDLDESTFDNFADSLVRLGNNMAAQESTIMNVAQRMSSVANVANMTTPQLLAWSAAIASTGQRSESAATAVSNTITGISAAVANGGKDLQGFASIAGMAADDFAEKWKSSPSEALKAFINGLQSLTDDNTGAIQALENMGISSVRQETALLGLASTVETLDDALAMSENAFNGVSDQWGDAGDAANEAQKKSEGFSGQLGILQNNASDLAATMGDGLVPIMENVSAVLKALSDFLNGLPTGLKSSVVSIGGLTVALGAIIPTVNQIKKGWADLIASWQSSPESIGMVKTAIIGMKDALSTIFTSLKAMPGAMVEAAASGGGLSAVFSAMGASASAAAGGVSALMAAAWPLLAIGAVVTAVSTVVDKFNEWRDHTKLVESANRSLIDTLDDAGSAYDEYANKLKYATQSAEEVKEEHEQFLQSQSDFIDSMSDMWKSVGTDSAMVDYYVDTINELAGACEGSEWNLSRLKEAVNGYNDITGASVQVTNDATGELNILTSALDSTTEAYKRNADVQANIDMYEATVKKRVDVQMELNELNAEHEEAEKRIAELEEKRWRRTWDETSELTSLASAQVERNTAIEETEARLHRLEDEESKLKATIDEQSDAYVNAATSISDYSSALASVGMDTSVLADLSDEERQKLDEIQAALSGAGDSLTNYGSLTAAQLAQIAAAWNKSVPDIVAAISKIKEETQSAAQVDYKSMAEEWKKIRDDEYDATKSALDKEYSEFQKAKNAEYSAASKASQKYLKEFKAAQDAEVEAFKAATDAKVAEIEREYEYKKQLLDDEYNARTSGLDDQIAAIKAEQDAEDKAAEQKEREEKLAELREAVRRARTKKKRAEAAKALSDYEEELAAKDRKSRREEQIQELEDQKSSLKDQYDNRVEILNKSKDDAISIYKEQREAELAILNEANEAAYEAEQELESARLESIKDANTAEIEAKKEANEQILKDLKSRNEAEVEAIKAGKTTIQELLGETTQAVQANNAEVAEATSESTNSVAASYETLRDKLRRLADDHKISVKTYLDASSKLPGSMKAVFDDLGITTETGLRDIARIMRENGQIGRDDYMAVIRGIPSATNAVFSENGLKVAEQLGLTKQAAESGARGIANAVDAGTKQAADAIGRNADNGRAALNEKLSGIPEDAAAIARSTNDKMAVAFSDNTSVVDAVEGEKLAVMSALDDLPEGVRKVCDLANGKMLVSLGDNEEVAAAMGMKKAAIVDSLEGLPDYMEEIGRTSDNRLIVAMSDNAMLAEVAGGKKFAIINAMGDLPDGVSQIAELANNQIVVELGDNADVSALGEMKAAAVVDSMDGLPAGLQQVAELANGQFVVTMSDTTGAEEAGRGLANAAGQGASETAPVLASRADDGTGAFVSGIESGQNPVSNAVIGLVNLIDSMLGGTNWSVSGYDMVVNFVNGIYSGNGILSDAMRWFTEMLAAWLGHSVPKEGPLREGGRGEAVWGEHLVQNFIDGMRGMESDLKGESKSLAGIVADNAFADQYGFVDPVDEIIAQMRAREGDLLEQAKRLSDIVEQGFDPKISIDAAYEAIDRIDAAQLRRQQLIAGSQSVDNSTYAPVININIPEMVVREEADVDRVSKQIATRLQRVLNSRVG